MFLRISASCPDLWSPRNNRSPALKDQVIPNFDNDSQPRPEVKSIYGHAPQDYVWSRSKRMVLSSGLWNWKQLELHNWNFNFLSICTVFCPCWFAPLCFFVQAWGPIVPFGVFLLNGGEKEVKYFLKVLLFEFVTLEVNIKSHGTPQHDIAHHCTKFTTIYYKTSNKPLSTKMQL